MRFVLISALQSNDTIAIPGVAMPGLGMSQGAGGDLTSSSFTLIQVIDVEPAEEQYGFDARITGTNLITNEPIGLRVPAGTVLMAPDQGELLLA